MVSKKQTKQPKHKTARTENYFQPPACLSTSPLLQTNSWRAFGWGRCRVSFTPPTVLQLPSCRVRVPSSLLSEGSGSANTVTLLAVEIRSHPCFACPPGCVPFHVSPCLHPGSPCVPVAVSGTVSEPLVLRVSPWPRPAPRQGRPCSRSLCCQSHEVSSRPWGFLENVTQ